MSIIGPSMPPRRSRAFTLVELIAASVVTAIIGSTAAMMLIEASHVRSAASLRSELTEESARSLEQMIRRIREIEQDAGLTGEAQIAMGQASRIQFGNYGFRLNAGNLQMTNDSQATWHRMAADADVLTFRYFRADGTELSAVPLSLADREAVRQVVVELRLQRGGEAARVRSRVYLRRFMNEAA
ncbi:MAG: type II secretion system protein [Phycisphaerae bacterium]